MHLELLARRRIVPVGQRLLDVLEHPIFPDGGQCGASLQKVDHFLSGIVFKPDMRVVIVRGEKELLHESTFIQPCLRIVHRHLDCLILGQETIDS